MARFTSWVLVLAMIVFGASVAQAAKGKKPKKTPEQRFSRADTNKDGKLSLDEFVGKRTADKKEKAEKQFHKRDKDGDKFLSAEEFGAAAKKKPA